jgi:hypothetical protein
MMDVAISPRSADLRRRLGPTAWMVLEELLLGADAGPDNETIACSESVRALGRKLGLDKDTVARSVQRLIAADLVCRAQPRTAAGAFARASYLIRIPDGLRAVVPEPACTTHRDAPERKKLTVHRGRPPNRSPYGHRPTRFAVTAVPSRRLTLTEALRSMTYQLMSRQLPAGRVGQPCCG